jgi:hypothetical protein
MESRSWYEMEKELKEISVGFREVPQNGQIGLNRKERRKQAVLDRKASPHKALEKEND